MTNKLNLIIHAGPHKTGTTSLQHFFFENKDNLQKQGILYPGTTANHHKFANKVAKNEDYTKYLKQFSQKANQLGCQTVLLSSEAFSKLAIRPDQMKLFSAELEKFFFVKIVYYLRRQSEKVESSFIQILKSRPLNESIVEFSEKTNYNYFKILNLWSNVFGFDNVIPVVYESEKGFDVIQSFVKTINLNFSGFKKLDRKNTKPSIDKLRLIHYLNQSISKKIGVKTKPKENRTLSKLNHALINDLTLPWTGITSYKILPFENAKKVMQRHEDSNSKVLSKFFPSREFLFINNIEEYDHQDLNFNLINKKNLDLFFQFMFFNSNYKSILNLEPKNGNRGKNE